MLNSQREQRIIELLQEHDVMTVKALSDALSVSAATVRRDLQTLHEKGLLRRVRGGATLRSLHRVEPLFHDKESWNHEAKQLIAERALEMINDHERIYLDGGSTILLLARLLDERQDLTVVTNSLMAADQLMGSKHRVILVGGEVRSLSRTLVGPLSESVIRELYVDKAFMGTIGFMPSDGISTTEPAEAFTKTCVMRHANEVILLVDSSKIGVPSFARSGGIDDLDVLVTEKIGFELREEVEQQGVRVVLTNPVEQKTVASGESIRGTS
jgi:DeoR/GlpR family transcriptional regulator of sugar metabolism